jgi:hypothetical protein
MIGDDHVGGLNVAVSDLRLLVQSTNSTCQTANKAYRLARGDRGTAATTDILKIVLQRDAVDPTEDYVDAVTSSLRIDGTWQGVRLGATQHAKVLLRRRTARP